ncbi:MAG: DUF3857 domain-containing protein [Bacteroidales bacterium]|nr:DUF3857 domain-containing protein [Bacteroidales bacterium]
MNRYHVLRFLVSSWILMGALTVTSFAEEGFYPASSIPHALTIGAGAVVRLSETMVEISSVKSIRKGYHLVITILHEDALDNASVYLYYNEFRRIGGASGGIFNAEGKEIQKIRLTDFTDRSAVPEGTLHSSDRVKIYTPVYNGTYPVTFEFEYDIIGGAPAHYPEWTPQDGYGVAIESASLTVSAPFNLFPRYYAVNIVSRDSEKIVGDTKMVTWHLDNLTALHREPYAPSLSERTPGVFLAPVKLDYRGFSEDFLTWNDVGKWINYLLKDRDVLPESVKYRMKQISDQCPDTISQIRAVFHYLQSSKRYVSIQMGIGGWQPLDATTVDEQGYGDCKALVNYTKALLQGAGINSFYTLVNAGSRVPDILCDFPSMQFNHAILCVPLSGDTIWLECTDPTIPFGFLGSFTDERHVLIVTDTDGVIARTPVYSCDMNRLNRKTVISLSFSGDAEIEMTTYYSGLQSQIVYDLARKGIEEQKKALASRIGIPDITIKSVTYTCDSNAIPIICERIVLIARSYASVSGERLFVPVNRMNRMNALTVNTEERQAPILTGYPYLDMDSILVKWPQGFHVEALPSGDSIDTPFGKCTMRIVLDSLQWIYTRSFEQNKVRFNVEDYPEFRSFINRVAKADRQKAILRKTGS